MLLKITEKTIRENAFEPKKKPRLSAHQGPGKYVFDKVNTSFVLALMC